MVNHLKRSPQIITMSGTKERDVKTTINLDDHPKIEGYNFSKPFDINKFLESYQTTGFQASHLYDAIQIIKLMRREKAKIFLGFTSNMISSGIREVITYLVKNKLVHCIVTSAGGIEEDVIKTFKPFHLGSFEASGKALFDSGVCRTGNLFVPVDRYTYFEKFMKPFLEQLQKNLNKNTIDMLEFTRALGEVMEDESSYLHWAAKNDIPVICPAPMDGALGDTIHYYRKNNPDFRLDVSTDIDVIIKMGLNSEKTGVILIGGGVAKHYILNAISFRDGADYAVYINTAQEFDGSDSGARAEEAITWGKIKTDAAHVKVHCDATIAFPLIVAGAFQD